MAEDKFASIINSLKKGEQPTINSNKTNQGFKTEERGLRNNTFGLKSVNEDTKIVVSTEDDN